MIFVFILFSFLAFFDLSSLRIHFWPLPFPSENFDGHGKKSFTGRTVRPRKDSRRLDLISDAFPFAASTDRWFEFQKRS
jgi:hypothetical protein